MFEKITKWANENSTEVTWFLIGILLADCIHSLARGEYLWSAFCATLVVLNYVTRRLKF